MALPFLALFTSAMMSKFVHVNMLLILRKLKLKASFQRLLFKQEGMRAAWEYPFAAAGINISFMLIQMLDLYSG